MLSYYHFTWNLWGRRISMDNMTEWFVFYPLIRPSRVSFERLNYRLTWEWEIQLINHRLFFVPLLAYYRLEELGDREDNYQLIASPPLTLCWTGKWRTMSESLSVLNIKCPSQWLMLANLLSRRGSHDQRCPVPLHGLSMMDKPSERTQISKIKQAPSPRLVPARWELLSVLGFCIWGQTERG